MSKRKLAMPFSPRSLVPGRDRNARALWLGRMVAFVAEQLTEIALIWFCWKLTGTSAAVAWMMFIIRAPFWIVSWAGGVLADRYSKKRLIRWTSAVGSAVALLVAGLFFYDRLICPC